MAYDKKRRGGHGAGMHKEKCALGGHFPYELLDIFIGAWCAIMVPHKTESELAPREGDDAAPVGSQNLDKALKHEHYNGYVEKLLYETCTRTVRTCSSVVCPQSDGTLLAVASEP